MVVPSTGEVVLVPLPFSDLSTTKVRPAVCLAAVGSDDWIMCQITSNPYGDPNALPVDSTDFTSGGLLVASFARPGKLFTADVSLIVRSVGKLKGSSCQNLLDAVVNLIRPSSAP